MEHCVQDLRADLFTAPLTPGDRWLVLVNGLDALLEPERRHHVVAERRKHRAGPDQFVIASRVLPDAGLTKLAWADFR